MTAAQRAPILIFARERYCPDVARTRRRLKELGIPWSERDVEADETAAAEMRKLTGRGSVPTVLIGDRVLVEPSNRELDVALEAGGYMTSVPGRPS
ncbi:MAG TPA: glutaredoxin family protein [Thermomicrobiales bacterium]|nr:glutaredoxin family protein [Thermomicrobiales bacterium]